MSGRENPCWKFQANVFQKRKCRNCFQARESHLLDDEDLCQARPTCAGWLLLAPEGTDFDDPLHRTQPSTPPQGAIDVNRRSNVMDAESRTAHENSLCILSPEKEHFLRAQRKETVSGWQEALSVYPTSNQRNPKKRKVEPPAQQSEPYPKPAQDSQAQRLAPRDASEAKAPISARPPSPAILASSSSRTSPSTRHPPPEGGGGAAGATRGGAPAALSAVPRAITTTSREAFASEKKRRDLGARTQSPGREEVARLFGERRRRSQVIDRFEESPNAKGRTDTSGRGQPSSDVDDVQRRGGERRNLSDRCDAPSHAAKERRVPDGSGCAFANFRRAKSPDRRVTDSAVTSATAPSSSAPRQHSRQLNTDLRAASEPERVVAWRWIQTPVRRLQGEKAPLTRRCRELLGQTADLCRRLKTQEADSCSLEKSHERATQDFRTIGRLLGEKDEEVLQTEAMHRSLLERKEEDLEEALVNMSALGDSLEETECQLLAEDDLLSPASPRLSDRVEQNLKAELALAEKRLAELLCHLRPGCARPRSQGRPRERDRSPPASTSDGESPLSLGAASTTEDGSGADAEALLCVETRRQEVEAFLSGGRHRAGSPLRSLSEAPHEPSRASADVRHGQKTSEEPSPRRPATQTAEALPLFAQTLSLEARTASLVRTSEADLLLQMDDAENFQSSGDDDRLAVVDADVLTRKLTLETTCREEPEATPPGGGGSNEANARAEAGVNAPAVFQALVAAGLSHPLRNLKLGYREKLRPLEGERAEARRQTAPKATPEASHWKSAIREAKAHFGSGPPTLAAACPPQLAPYARQIRLREARRLAEKVLERRLADKMPADADGDQLGRRCREELRSVQRELQVLSQRSSQKCLENAHLARAPEAERWALGRRRRENRELDARKQESNGRLSAEVARVRSCLSGETAPLPPVTKDVYQLEVMLRVKESEIQHLEWENHSLKDELQSALRDKKYATDKHEDIHAELSVAEAVCQICKLKGKLHIATRALGDGSVSSGYDILKSKSNPDLTTKEQTTTSEPSTSVGSKSLQEGLTVQECMKLFEAKESQKI